MRNVRVAAALTLCCLLAAGCGTRITPEQRQLVLSGGAGAAAGTGAGGGAAAPLGGTGAAGARASNAGGTVAAGTPGGTPAGAAAGGGGAAAPGAGAAGGGAPAPGGSAGAQDASGGAGQTPGGGGGGNTRGGGGGGGGRVDTASMPPGGNGGETDTGVTETEIVISNVSDTSGAVPDLFKDAQLAVEAYVEYFNNVEGAIYGRKLKYLPLDSQLDANGNRNRYLQACEQSFAAVGSMSAFEQGAAPVVRDCGIPDLRTATVHPDMMRLPTVYPADAMRVGVQPLAEYQYWKSQFPQAVKKSGYLYIESETTDYQTGLVKAGTEKIGYRWPVYRSIPLSQTNYSSYVLEMKREGVRFVTFQGAYQQAVRLADTMRQQGFKPDVFALQSNSYTPNFIAEGGSSVEGTHIAVPSVILEEANQHRELQVYAQWLNQVEPGAQPTGLGMYAWSAAEMFAEAAKDAGPKLTRQGLINAVKGVHKFTGNGLLPAQDIGGKYPSDCVVVVVVKGGRFVRQAPSKGFTCSKPVKV